MVIDMGSPSGQWPIAVQNLAGIIVQLHHRRDGRVYHCMAQRLLKTASGKSTRLLIVWMQPSSSLALAFKRGWPGGRPRLEASRHRNVPRLGAQPRTKTALITAHIGVNGIHPHYLEKLCNRWLQRIEQAVRSQQTQIRNDHAPLSLPSKFQIRVLWIQIISRLRTGHGKQVRRHSR